MTIEGNGNGEKRGVTFKYLLGVSGGIIVVIFSLLFSAADKRMQNAEARITTVEQNKLDIREHDKDIAEIREYMKDIRETLREHEAASRKRAGE